ncbi:hypothetical protein [Nereida sp. MMG025]|uniref:hypothetical protein n=1 Tax=Nereida sp. MMG025 TaxID=2909981 RepID=UPI001F37A0F9|nr:hypothetical protein [Nereida sp. MMG025]MCF6444486.1 hypothetical protein [Nereida sp. MMG025]
MTTRRGFLAMIGGALAAPVMPSVSWGAARKAVYPLSALHAAIFHAKTDVTFSVFTLAKRLGLDLDQAEVLMTDLSKRGVVGPLQGTTQAGRWARSNIWQRPAGPVGRPAQHRTSSRQTAPRAQQPYADLRPFLQHLYASCRAQGMTPHPRCAVLLKGYS